jgi:hypothetical protein
MFVLLHLSFSSSSAILAGVLLIKAPNPGLTTLTKHNQAFPAQ